MEWIKVEDRLPDKEERVLYYAKEVGIWVGKWELGYEDMIVWGGPHGFLGGGEVTHWMPLPDYPE